MFHVLVYKFEVGGENKYLTVFKNGNSITYISTMVIKFRI